MSSNRKNENETEIAITIQHAEELAEAEAFQDLPIIVKVPATHIYFLRLPNSDWVSTDRDLLPGYVREYYGDEAVIDPERTGRNLSLGGLFERHGLGRLDRVVYEMGRPTSDFVPSANGGGTLFNACGQLDPDLTPEYSPPIDRWIGLLGGDPFRDWLATSLDVSRPTCAVYLCGPPSSGKSLLANGVARCFGGTPVAYQDAVGQYNGALLDNPIVFLDEGAARSPAGTAEFRTLVSETSHSIREKYQPTSTLLGCPRLIVAANNGNALVIREDLTLNDQEAIAERILYVECDRRAREYLEELGGRAVTESWLPVRGLGPLPRHIAWLAANRRVVPGKRFAMTGNGAVAGKITGLDGGFHGIVVTTILNAMTSPRRYTQPESVPYHLTRDGGVLVSAQLLAHCWEHFSTTRPPSVRKIQDVLRDLSGEGEAAKVQHGNQRIRMRRIPARHLLRAAEELDLGDLDGLREQLGVPNIEE